ncbi:hypothetical protein ACWC4J_39025 [Streptomyces sp. NPDC001356]
MGAHHAAARRQRQRLRPGDRRRRPGRARRRPRAAETEQQRLQEQQLVARADELAALASAGRLDQNVETRPGDDAARDLLAHRGTYHLVVDGWMAQPLADRSGHDADPAARTAAPPRPPTAS